MCFEKLIQTKCDWSLSYHSFKGYLLFFFLHYPYLIENEQIYKHKKKCWKLEWGNLCGCKMDKSLDKHSYNPA